MAKKKAANVNAGQAGNAVPAPRPLPADPNLLRRLHRAIHDFCGWLEAELEAAVAAANHRQLGAVRFVEQALGYVRQRCLTEADPSNRVAVQKPTGFSVDPDLVLALGCLEATAFSLWSSHARPAFRSRGARSHSLLPTPKRSARCGRGVYAYLYVL